jgi:CRP-like cAMP-binding protein
VGTPKRSGAFDPQELLQRIDRGKTARTYQHGQLVFSQGDAADAVFYVGRGRVELTVVSPHGRHAVIGLLRQGSFFGEGCMAGQRVRRSTASSLRASRVMRVDRRAMVAVLNQEPELAAHFIAYLLSRNLRIEEDLLDQLFTPSETRLARVLLVLARFVKEPGPERMIPRLSHDALATMVGTTRSRVAYIMGRFRRMGFIHYDGGPRGGLLVHSALLTVVLRD